MNTLDSQLNECLPDWAKLVASLIPNIQDDDRASDCPDDTRDCDPSEVAEEIADQIGELVTQ